MKKKPRAVIQEEGAEKQTRELGIYKLGYKYGRIAGIKEGIRRAKEELLKIAKEGAVK